MLTIQEKVHYPGLDTLRGIAIILVVIYHYFPFFRIGWIGVDLFFVLSGFLITSILLKSRGEKDYFKKFFIRRALRILPLYYLVLLIFYIGLHSFSQQRGAHTAYEYYTHDQVWLLSFMQNWLIIKKGPPPEPYLMHFWSLAVEEQFYIGWPIVIYFIKEIQAIKKLLVVIFVLALLLRIFFWYMGLAHEEFYYNSFSRLDSLAAGAFLSVIIIENRKLSPLFIWIIVSAFFTILVLAAVVYKDFNHDSFLFATIGYSISALFFMALCFIAIKTRLSIFSNRALHFVGRISYGIYVYHLPVFLAGSYVLKKTNVFRGAAGSFEIPLMCMIATLAISVVSYRVLELPFLRLKSQFA